MKNRTILDFSAFDDEKPKIIKSPLTNIPKFNNVAGAVIITIFVMFFVGVFLALIFAPIIFYIALHYINLSGNTAIKLSNFAVKNNFKYQWAVRGKKAKFDGILGASNNLFVGNEISGKYKDFNFRMFNLTKKLFVIMQIDLNNNYPHIVLDSTKNESLFGPLGELFRNGSKIKLEGDFNNYFDVFSEAPPIDTLRILSPDMMALMIDNGHMYDIELVDDKLQIISNYKFDNSKQVEDFFFIADTLLEKLDRRLATSKADFDSESRVK